MGLFESKLKHDYFIPDRIPLWIASSPLTPPKHTNYGAKRIDENDGILRPEPLIEHKQGTPFKLMYF